MIQVELSSETMLENVAKRFPYLTGSVNRIRIKLMDDDMIIEPIDLCSVDNDSYKKTNALDVDSRQSASKDYANFLQRASEGICAEFPLDNLVRIEHVILDPARQAEIPANNGYEGPFKMMRDGGFILRTKPRRVLSQFQEIFPEKLVIKLD